MTTIPEAIDALAVEYEVQITQLSEDVSNEMRLCGKMLCFDKVITMGAFKDKSLQVALFYHELSHIVLGMTSACSYEEERVVWQNAFTLMRRHNHHVPYSVLKQCINQLYEYRDV